MCIRDRYQDEHRGGRHPGTNTGTGHRRGPRVSGRQSQDPRGRGALPGYAHPRPHSNRATQVGAYCIRPGSIQEAALAPLVTVTDPRSPSAEAYRTLRNNIQFSSLDHPMRTLLITSAGADEGKSTTLCNPVSYTHLRAHETRHDLVC